MPTPRELIAANVARTRERIAAAAQAAGRDPAEIKLVAVSKYVDAGAAALLVSAGCHALGEARPQQLWEKAAAPELAGVEWHLIGRLQRNKIRRTLPLVSLIHSVDSARLLAAINDEAATLGTTCRVLLEVNCSGDAAKQGFTAEGVRALLPELPNYAHLEVAGLMTMAALDGDDAVARANFAALRLLRDELARESPPTVMLRELSMGMSGDFEIAVAEGTTIVRVGSSLVEGLRR
ncbi:YggS family pyridoxal phosphate-dependent enzyme [Lacipirellula limnantheis]|uniref:Pyridoxal phosphate homeostasis protein n=1 Tax=Lacipirellula limnantheis TaxID=2528024 RepID=A0A517TXI7_9BACT|nr:YggS family pyridoxal phosphate-dependent enzyme [Lacipirellula limnantheis]QDT73095.1 Pyridoxal phosphate homeostasis protein [Lacipirellula limnantheis]